MNRRLGAIGLLVAVAAVSFAWRWPTATLSATVAFGQSSDGAYSRGIELAGGTQAVYPVASGTVVYVREPLDSGPFQLGTTIVVEHDRGFRSFYGHLEAGTTAAPGSFVTESTQIGAVGVTGTASHPSLFFSILDTESGAYVNPLLLLPAVEDTVSPTIIAILARNDTSLYNLSTGSTVPAGEYAILVESEDRWTRSGETLTPYSVVVLVDGQEHMALTRDRIVFTDGYPRLQPGPAISHDELQTRSGGLVTDRVTIPIGRTLVEVVVSDFSGNQTSVVIEVTGGS